MDLVVERFRHGFLMKAADGRSELARVEGDIVAIYPQAGRHAGAIYDDYGLANDGFGRLKGPLSDILAAIARQISASRDGRSRSPRDRRRCTHCGECEDEPEDYEAICDPCLRRRDAQAPARSAQARR